VPKHGIFVEFFYTIKDCLGRSLICAYNLRDASNIGGACSSRDASTAGAPVTARAQVTIGGKATGRAHATAGAKVCKSRGVRYIGE
jgi:hypothetical protein